MGSSFATGRFDAPVRCRARDRAPDRGERRRLHPDALPRRDARSASASTATRRSRPRTSACSGDFGASAATAVATAESAVTRALRLSIEAAERERRHWARELHDQTLQELGALRMLCAAPAARRTRRCSRRRSTTPSSLLGEAVAELRLLITELRPAALDQLGVAAALEALTERARKLSPLDIELAVDLAFERGAHPQRLEADLEGTVYRIVQEALTNVVRHARAEHVAIEVAERDGEVVVDVRDDGVGFSSDGTPRGFGLVGMHERATLAGGDVRIESVEGAGTRVAARLPVRRRSP